MTEREAHTVIDMVESEWRRKFEPKQREHWAKVLVSEEWDAALTVKAVGIIASEASPYAPTLPELRGLMRTLAERDRPPAQRCATCGDDKWVVYELVKMTVSPYLAEHNLVPKGWDEKYVPCPDCNAAAYESLESFRHDGTRFKAPDIGRVREVMIPAPPPTPPVTEIPEWVHVWKWARRNGAVRPFPQQVPALTPSEQQDALSWDEYDHLLELWKKAGEPRSRNPVEAAVR